ncbi:MAG TPA: diacylglycerol kinase family protein [Ktedonobacteraceae bacterium]|jgi:YegS/Rv2252/BmrU family lipid kinase
MQTAVILNPGAGTSPIAQQHVSDEEFEANLLRILHDLEIDAEVYYTTLEDPGEGIARQLADKQTDLVIAVGGDGTMHSVARGLLGSSSVLAIIPAGTMNNLAYSLGIPQNLQAACAILVAGEARAIDVGSINKQIFLEVAGVGLEAALYPAAEEVKSRGFFSVLKGACSGLWTLLNFHPPEMSITFDHEKARTYRALQLTACNAPYYGVHMNTAPGIFMNDGWLDIVLYTNFSKSEFLRHALSISRGQRPFAPKLIYRRVKSLTVRTNPAIDIHADGTVIGKTPAEITIMPGVLKVQVPRTPVAGLLAVNQEQKRLRRFSIRRGKTYV